MSSDRAWKTVFIREWLAGGSVAGFATRQKIAHRHVEIARKEWLASLDEGGRARAKEARRDAMAERKGKAVISDEMLRIGDALDRVICSDENRHRLADYLQTTTGTVADIIRGQIDLSYIWLRRIGNLFGMEVKDLFDPELKYRIKVDYARLMLARERRDSVL